MAAKLKELPLFRERAYVDGQWVEAKSGSRFDVIGASGCCYGSCSFLIVS